MITVNPNKIEDIAGSVLLPFVLVASRLTPFTDNPEEDRRRVRLLAFGLAGATAVGLYLLLSGKK